jgi:oligopeptide transport system substrate-binding protein
MVKLHPGSSTRRGLRSLAVLAGTVLVAIGCGQGGSQPQALAKDQSYRVNVVTEPVTLDPGQTQYVYEFDVMEAVSESLLKPKADLSDVEGAAAEKWDVSSDGLTWTFHLRKNSWSDGQPVKAQDFVYAWQRILDPTLAAPYADPFFDGVVKGAADYSNLDPKKDAAKIPAFLNGLGLSAPDDNTFVVKLEQPAPYFKWVASLFMSAPVRKDVVAKYGSDSWAKVAPETAANIPTSGPFKYSEIAPKDHIAVVPNPKWTGKKPTLTKITFFEIGDQNAAYAKYLNGELDEVDVPLANTDLVRNDATLSKQAVTVPNLLQFWLGFNTKKAPFDNPKVRMAFSTSVDRDKLANDVGKKRFTNSALFIPKGQPGYNGSLASIQKFDPAAAKALLQGVTLPSINLLTRDITANKQIAEFLKDQWKTNLGVDVNIEVVDSKTVSKRQTKLDYQFSVQGWQADYPDPQDWFDNYECGSGNQFSGYCNKQYDDVVKKADQELNKDNRQKLYDQAQETLLRDAPIGALYQRVSYHLEKPYVKGVQSTPLDGGYFGSFFITNISLAQH